MSDLLFADRSERAKLRVGDEQRLWFLDQLLTQSFGDMEPGEARDTALITVHGRMQAYMEAVATDDSVLLHYEPELRTLVPETLAKYVFATRVTLDDVTEEMGLVLVVGPGWRELAALDAEATPHETKSLGAEAGYLWMQRTRVGAFVKALRSEGVTETNEQELEAIRIGNGVPRWGRDMNAKTFPQEAGVDSLAVHYQKGCYLGQEAMAKIHFRGKVNRRLARLTSGGALVPGTDLFAEDQKVGTITSSADGRALALVKHTLEEGTEVRAGAYSARVVS
ncbi:MAG: hypothetical protein M3198_01095 [Actinomycetota bacterium]|nr:hypothetical protein [Actinomycetota bacterium]